MHPKMLRGSSSIGTSLATGLPRFGDHKLGTLGLYLIHETQTLGFESAGADRLHDHGHEYVTSSALSHVRPLWACDDGAGF
jgi:hypothetical protein